MYYKLETLHGVYIYTQFPVILKYHALSAEFLPLLVFKVEIVQNPVKIGPFSNCYIQAINKGKNDNHPSLESSEIGFYVCDSILCPPIKFVADISIF